MVVMDREDYTDKALSLLTDINTWKTITKDPTSKLRNKHSQTLRDIKNEGGLSDHSYKKVYPTSTVAPKFYGHSKIHKIGTPSDPLSAVGVYHMEWPRSWPTSFVTWLASPHTISKTLNTLYNTSRRLSWNQGTLWHLIMSRPTLLHFLWTLPSTQSNKNYNRTHCFHKGPTFPYNK